MRKYEIQLVRKVGSNSYQFMRINSFETREQWQSALRKLMRGLNECNCSSLVSYSRTEELDIAYVNIESK